MKVAILVDGGFYLKRARSILGEKTPDERAKELFTYCIEHLSDKRHDVEMDLYRIYYYDCKPINKKIFHPLLQKQIDLSRTDLYQWNNEFLSELMKKRKFALRLGKLSEVSAHYTIKYDTIKKLMNGNKTVGDLKEEDFYFNIEQKGVDMKIGIDIATLAFKRQVDKIILISGDSDFVPAAKLARREGIDFVLDPLYATIKTDLHEHIDGIETKKPFKKRKR